MPVSFSQLYRKTETGQSVSFEQIRITEEEAQMGYRWPASLAITSLLRNFVARWLSDNFVIFRKLGGRANHFPDIEIGRLQLKA
jgi:hypothetical protein